MAAIDVEVRKLTLRDAVVKHKDIVYLALSFLAILIIMVNALTFSSPFIGAIASITYILVNGNFIGDGLFKEARLKLPLGILFLFILFGLFGWLFMVFYELSMMSVVAVLCIATSFSFFTYKFEVIKRKILRRSKKHQKINVQSNMVSSSDGVRQAKKSIRSKIRLLAFVIVFSSLVILCASLLLASRTKAGPWHVWTVVNPWVWPVYLVTIFFLTAILMSGERSELKISFTVVFSVLTCLVYVMVFDAGMGWDTWVHMAYARTVYENFSPTPFSIHFPRASIGLNLYYSTRAVIEYSLPVVFARMFSVDVFWTHLIFGPLLWGLFLPVICYSVAKILGAGERAAVLSTFLVLSSHMLIAWGGYSVPQSLGYIFCFLTLYLLLRYLSGNSIFPALITTFASFLSHYITGALSLSFLLFAFVYKRRHITKYRTIAHITLVLAFLTSVSVLPFLYYAQQLVYPINVGFTLSKLGELPHYDAILSLIFTRYQEYTLSNFVALGGITDLLGFLGLLMYSVIKPKKKSQHIYHFLLLAFLMLAVDLRIVTWFMTGVPTRIWPLASLIAVPAASIVIVDSISSVIAARKTQESNPNRRKADSKFFNFDMRKAEVMVIVVFCISGMVAAPVYHRYDLKVEGVTAYDMEVARYIYETTELPYVVICDTPALFAGQAVVGMRNPRAYYRGVYDRPNYFAEMVSNPSPEIMKAAAGLNDASFQYFVVGTTSIHLARPRLSEVVEAASRYFEEYKVFGDGENLVIYVFRYKTPPFPYSSDVAPFYWDLGTPPTYMIQNDLIRVIVPQNRSLEVRDFREKLYMGIDFGETLVDGYPLSNVSRVEYFNPSSETWNAWVTSEEIDVSFAMKQQFKFKLSFDKVALVAVVERGKPFTQLRWESLDGLSHDVTCHVMTDRYDGFSASGLTSPDSPGSVHLRKYGAYYTVTRTDDVALHYAYNYETSGDALYPYEFKSHSGFTTIKDYLYLDLYVDNEANEAQWIYVEMYLPDKISPGALAPFSYSTNNGKNWTGVYKAGPLKTLNETEVNWVVVKARKWNEEPTKWAHFQEAAGGVYDLPDNFLTTGGVWNRIIFGMYLLGDTNRDSETSSGSSEGDQALVRLGVGTYNSPLEATYIFTDSEDFSYGLRNMNDPFLTFYTGLTAAGGISFTKRLKSLSITATKEDKTDHITFDIPCDTTFSLLAKYLSESESSESLARMSYTVSQSDDRISLTADVTSTNDWDQTSVVTMCIPSDYNHEGGVILDERGLSTVLAVNVVDDRTETVTIWPK